MTGKTFISSCVSVRNSKLSIIDGWYVMMMRIRVH